MSFTQLAAEYHGGQWTALYRYSCNGKVLNYEHRAELILELEKILAGFESLDYPHYKEEPDYYREYIRVQSFLVYVYETECDDSPLSQAITYVREYFDGILESESYIYYNDGTCLHCGNCLSDDEDFSIGEHRENCRLRNMAKFLAENE